MDSSGISSFEVHFPDQLIGASLKLLIGDALPVGLGDFPDQLIGASLKPAIFWAIANSSGDFPDQLIGASLKPMQVSGLVPILVSFPRSADRGLIEATPSPTHR